VSNCDMATSWLLPRLIGASRAHELMLTARRVGAEEAQQIGLVADVVEDEAIVERSLEAAGQVAAWAPWGIRLTKQGMWSALEMPSELSAIEYEDRQQIMSIHGNAPREAVSAFLEKRTAEFAD
jgi:enoyl-CoA hydratase